MGTVYVSKTLDYKATYNCAKQLSGFPTKITRQIPCHNYQGQVKTYEFFFDVQSIIDSVQGVQSFMGLQLQL